MNAAARFDLHVHSRHSPDSAEPVEAILARASAIGLRGLALTDHNTVDGHAELAALGPRWPGLLLVPGIEVSTREGHLLLYGIDSAPPRDLPLDAALQWAQARGAVAVLAHPFRFFHGVGGPAATAANVPAIETCNGHTGPRSNRRAEAVRAARRLGGTGGSDAHAALDLGRCTSQFARPIDTVADLLVELRAGRVAAQGRGPSVAERIQLALGTFGRRAGRGFRPV